MLEPDSKLSSAVLLTSSLVSGHLLGGIASHGQLEEAPNFLGQPFERFEVGEDFVLQVLTT